MAKKVRMIFLFSILAILTFALVVYFAIFDRVVIVQDASWPLVLPKEYYLRLRIDLAKEKHRLKVVKLSQSDFIDESYIKTELKKQDTGGVVITTPVVSAAIMTLNLDVSELFERTAVIGIGMNNGKNLFDMVLISDEISGWEEACRSGLEQNEKPALLYDVDFELEARAIFGFFNSEIKRYEVSENDNIVANEIKEKMDSEKISVVFCPHIDNLMEFFRENNSQKWIVDYRFSLVVPKTNLRGIIVPNIMESIREYLNIGLFESLPSEGTLKYAYRKAERSLF